MATSIDLPVLDTQLTADLCVKCNICTAACPVAAVTELFPGPKVVGPQAQRFRAPGAPVVDQDGAYIGFISEVDILKALAAGQDLTALTAEQLMVHNPIAVHRSTPIAEAIKIMADKHLLNLPVEEDGTVTYSVTRHDLLRASIGLAVAIED